MSSERKQLSWGERGYGEIERVASRGSWLSIVFRNGQQAEIDGTQLTNGRMGEWDRIMVEPEQGLRLTIPTDTGPIDVMAEHIREATDPAFANYVAWCERYVPASIGARIRCLRETREISGAELARLIGVLPQALSRIEHGRREPGIRTITRILGALGADWSDLAVTDAEHQHRVESTNRQVRRHAIVT